MLKTIISVYIVIIIILIALIPLIINIVLFLYISPWFFILLPIPYACAIGVFGFLDKNFPLPGGVGKIYDLIRDKIILWCGGTGRRSL